jgi:hypothetical protein
VRGAGLEPARYFYHEPLKLACLPFHHPRHFGRSLRSTVDGRACAPPRSLPRSLLSAAPARRFGPGHEITSPHPDAYGPFFGTTGLAGAAGAAGAVIGADAPGAEPAGPDGITGLAG